MSLNLALVISADAKAVAPATAEARREIESVGTAAKTASTQQAAAAAEATKAQQAVTQALLGRSAAEVQARGNVLAMAAANANVASSTGLAAHEVTNLTRQFADLGVMFGSGQSPLMAMITQGPQIADIFGQRGLRSILSGVVQGLTAMINPITLALGGVTALGYAISFAFEQIQGDVADANLSVEEHAELVDRVVKRWGAAVPELKAYNDELQRTKDVQEALKALQLTAAERYEPVREALPQLQVTLGDIVPILSTQGAESDAVGAFITAFEDLQRKIADSTATADDAIRVQKALADANIYGNDVLKGYAAGFGAFADQLRKVNQEAQKYRTLQDGGVLLNPDGKTSQLSPINPLDGFNRTPFQREDEIQEDRARRQREAEENKRLGGLVPTPTPRPNLEDALPSARDFIETQEEQLARLRLERELLGATTAERERAIAALEAEQQIRRSGIDAQGEEAQALRRNAAAIADATTELERHEAAWRKAQRAGESMIDTIFDRLASGDIEGLLADLSKTLTRELASLAAGGVKNALYGSDYPTVQDFGGLGGFLGALFGGKGGAGPNVPRVLPPANDNAVWAAPLEAVTRTPLADVGSRVLARREAIASIESAGSGGYAAIGPTHPTLGRALGRYQIMEANIGPWSQAALGRRVTAGEFLRDGALQDRIFDHRFGGYADRFGETGAAQAWFGGPGSIGKLGRSDVLGTTVGAYSDKFESAMRRFSDGAATAKGALDQLASGSIDATKGVGAFGQSLVGSGGGQGGGGGGLLGFLSKLFGGGTSSFFPAAPVLGAGMSTWAMTGLFETGGYTGDGHPADVAGVVHRGEFVYSAPAVRAIGRARLEAHHNRLKGYSGGGYVEGAAPTSHGPGFRDGAGDGSRMAAPTIVFENRGTAQRMVEQREESDGQGGRRVVYVLDDMVADQVGRRGSATQRSLRGMGVRAPVVRT